MRGSGKKGVDKGMYRIRWGMREAAWWKLYPARG